MKLKFACMHCGRTKNTVHIDRLRSVGGPEKHDCNAITSAAFQSSKALTQHSSDCHSTPMFAPTYTLSTDEQSLVRRGHHVLNRHCTGRFGATLAEVLAMSNQTGGSHTGPIQIAVIEPCNRRRETVTVSINQHLRNTNSIPSMAQEQKSPLYRSVHL